MLIAEVKWLGQNIFSTEPDKIFPMLNIGSSTEEFRTIDQPWIDEHITAPAKKNNFKIMNTDIKKEEGVDIVLEHLTNREQFCESILSVTPPGGYIFVSCPYKYPYHPDPIDTKCL